MYNTSIYTFLFWTVKYFIVFLYSVWYIIVWFGMKPSFLKSISLEEMLKIKETDKIGQHKLNDNRLCINQRWKYKTLEPPSSQVNTSHFPWTKYSIIPNRKWHAVLFYLIKSWKYCHNFLSLMCIYRRQR